MSETLSPSLPSLPTARGPAGSEGKYLFVVSLHLDGQHAKPDDLDRKHEG